MKRLGKHLLASRPSSRPRVGRDAAYHIAQAKLWANEVPALCVASEHYAKDRDGGNALKFLLAARASLAVARSHMREAEGVAEAAEGQFTTADEAFEQAERMFDQRCLRFRIVSEEPSAPHSPPLPSRTPLSAPPPEDDPCA